MILKPIKTQIYKQNIKLSQYMLNIANECKDDKVKIYRIMKLWCIYIQVHKKYLHQQRNYEDNTWLQL